MTLNKTNPTWCHSFSCFGRDKYSVPSSVIVLCMCLFSSPLCTVTLVRATVLIQWCMRISYEATWVSSPDPWLFHCLAARSSFSLLPPVLSSQLLCSLQTCHLRQATDTLLGTVWPRSVFSPAQLTTHTLRHRCTWHLGQWQDIRWGQRNPGDKEKRWTFAVILSLWAHGYPHTPVRAQCLPVKRAGIVVLVSPLWKPVKAWLFTRWPWRSLIATLDSKVFYFSAPYQQSSIHPRKKSHETGATNRKSCRRNCWFAVVEE